MPGLGDQALCYGVVRDGRYQVTLVVDVCGPAVTGRACMRHGICTCMHGARRCLQCAPNYTSARLSSFPSLAHFHVANQALPSLGWVWYLFSMRALSDDACAPLHAEL